MIASPAIPGSPPPTTRSAGAGQTLVLVAVFLGVLLVLLGAVVSVSSTDAAYGQAQDAANTAALAGAQGVLLGRDDSTVTQAMVRALQAQGTFTTVTVTATAPPAQAAPMTLWVQARYLDPAGQPGTYVSVGAPPSGASGVRVDAATLFAQPVLGALLGRSRVVLKAAALARRGPPPHLETP
jgi:Flp pilus assembly protein TadG